MKIAGIVLAGGQSSRMGQDKAKLTIQDNTLLSRAISLLQASGFKDCYVSGDYPGFNCIVDKQSAMGPIAGIAACATELNDQYDGIFIIPVDMPLLASKDCDKLLKHFMTCFTNQSFTGKQGVYYKAATFPMLLALNDTLLNYLAKVCESPYKKHRSLFRLLDTLNIEGLEQQQVDAFRFENANTPEQWQHCLKTYASMQTGNDNGNDNDNNKKTIEEKSSVHQSTLKQ